MKKVEKSNILATAYQAWVDTLEDGKHPAYNSSKNEFYLDIVMSLFACQKGLCAYTELPLCVPERWEDKKWENGRYIDRTYQYEGNLDHFDPNLKKCNGWLWDNLFMIHSDINRRKSTKIAHLKPDEPDYDPDNVMRYTLSTGEFIAQEGVDQGDINDLGINDDFALDRRRKKCAEWRRYIELSDLKWEELNIDCFPTAAKALKRELEQVPRPVGPPPSAP